MDGYQIIGPRRPVASDSPRAEVSLAGVGTQATATVVLSFRTPAGLDGEITAFRQAWDSGLDPQIRYSLRINGGIPSDYNQLNVQVGTPAGGQDLPLPIPVGAGSLVEVTAYALAGATFPGNFTAQVVAKYYNPK